MHRHLRLLVVAVVFVALAAIPAAASAAVPFDLYWNTTPDSWGSASTANFQISADDVDADDLSFTCSLDGALATACTRMNEFDELADGPHSFTQTGTDGADSESLTFDWVVDDGIGAYFYGKPDSLTNDRWAWFGWGTAGDPDHVECKLDGAAWATCAGGTTERYVSAGEHTFSVRAVDAEGNPQAYPTSYTWTIDTSVPVISTNLPNVVTSGDFALEIDVDDPAATVSCIVDEEDTDCDIDFSEFTDGSEHFLDVRAEDALGNTGYYYKEFGYQVGASLAQITAHGPRIKSSTGTSTFEFSADTGATIECSYNWNDFETCTSPVTVQEKWFDDHYSFRVRAVQNGITQNTPDAFYWYVGDRPFDLYLDNDPGKWTSENEASFAVQADEWDDDDLTYTCSLDGAAFAACGDTFYYDDLEPGEHEVRIHATSTTEGGSEELTFNWRVSPLPGSWFTETPSKFTNNSDATLYWSSSENTDGWQCKLDDAELWSVCEGSYYENLTDLAEGEHTFQVRALNSSAETEQDPAASYTWTVDQTNPLITASVPSGPITTDPYTLPISANEEGVEIYCVLDDGDEEDIFVCDHGAELSGLSRGLHTISMWGYDRAYNNSNSETYVFDWQPATPAPPVVTPPAAPIAKPTLSKPSKPKNGKVTVPYSCGDATCVVTVKFKLGKKSQSLKKLIVRQGAGKAQLKLSTSQKKWLGKKGKKKATMTVKITGASGSSSQTLKF
ncbi:MAG: hypothetical protein ACRDKE_11200 [Solirubrobacterales bacterium]